MKPEWSKLKAVVMDAFASFKQDKTLTAETKANCLYGSYRETPNMGHSRKTNRGRLRKVPAKSHFEDAQMETGGLVLPHEGRKGIRLNPRDEKPSFDNHRTFIAVENLPLRLRASPLCQISRKVLCQIIRKVTLIWV
jgi:hypothetical protein